MLEEPNELRVPVARETLELYSPLANRLGVWELKWELEDLCLPLPASGNLQRNCRAPRREANRT
jgi:(p)ppGpp synthase/HD superfamily hydrolase